MGGVILGYIMGGMFCTGRLLTVSVELFGSVWISSVPSCFLRVSTFREMELCLLLFLWAIPTSLQQEDMGGKVFIFPKQTSTDHVILKHAIDKPLDKVTVCLSLYSDLTRAYSLFSLATPTKSNAFLIFSEGPSAYSMTIMDIGVTMRTEAWSIDWRHVCTTWDSDTGLVQLWVNGKLHPRKFSITGYSIPAEAIIILGQDQDNYGGKFEASQSFVGEITDVNMWDDVLTPGDILKVMSGDLHGNVINWKSLSYTKNGGVVVQPKLQCKYWGSLNSLYVPCV